MKEVAQYWKKLNSLDSSPVCELSHSLFLERQLKVFVKMDHLLRMDNSIHFSGNKIRKLKYNLEEAAQKGHGTLVAIGGTHSNLLTAVAEAGRLFRFQTVGLISGEPDPPANPSIAFMRSCGMDLRFLPRNIIRKDAWSAYLKQLESEMDKFYFIPLGGSNEAAIRGCEELAMEISTRQKGDFNYVCLSCGTGCTMKGLLKSLPATYKVLGFPAFKAKFLEQELEDFSKQHEIPRSRFELIHHYHFGGIGRYKPELIDFIRNFSREMAIDLDPIYTGKLFYAVFDLAQKGYFPAGSSILVVHSGGLQGREGFESQNGLKL